MTSQTTQALQVNLQSIGLSTQFTYFTNSHAHIVRILGGETYPLIPEIGAVQTIVDIGANVGAASVMLAASYPQAVVHAFEPGPAPRELLAANVAPLARVTIHPYGLAAKDEECRLYRSRWDPMSASVLASAENTGEYDMIRLRRARTALHEAGIDSIDVLKIDTEGCELPVLTDCADIVARTRVIYLEYHSDADRRRIDRLLEPTHVLASAAARQPHRGDVCYVNADTDYARKLAVMAIGT